MRTSNLGLDIPVLPNDGAGTYLLGAVLLQRVAREVNSNLVTSIMTPISLRSSPFVVILSFTRSKDILVNRIIFSS